MITKPFPENLSDEAKERLAQTLAHHVKPHPKLAYLFDQIYWFAQNYNLPPEQIKTIFNVGLENGGRKEPPSPI